MRFFFQPNISTQNYLSEEESRHAVKVLRLTAGDEISILDGFGNSFTARITEPDSKKCVVELIATSSTTKRSYFLELIVAPTKSFDKMEWLVEKAVEVGVDKLTLISTKRSERSSIRMDRLEKIAISAMKQSKNFFLPQISELVSFNEIIRKPFDGKKLIAHCSEGEKNLIKNVLLPNSNYQILIGPEGDFTDEEITLALSANYVPVSLGESRLRTETAALYACIAASVVNG
jgi:16S rRNA (uracil1498-N3)-methyltransferase